MVTLKLVDHAYPLALLKKAHFKPAGSQQSWLAIELPQALLKLA